MPDASSPESLETFSLPTIDSLKQEISALNASSRKLSGLRLGSFFALIVGFFAMSSESVGQIGLLAISLPAAIIFGIAFVKHGRVLDRKERLDNRRSLLEECVERKTSRRRTRPLPAEPRPSDWPLEQGLRIYAEEPDHYALDAGAAEDLAILSGPRSIFGFLDVSSTLIGARRLQYILTHPLTHADSIRSRQKSVSALASAKKTRWSILETLFPLRSQSVDDIPEYLRMPTTFAGRTGLLIVATVLGTLAPILLIGCFFLPSLMAWLFLVAIINLAIIGSFVKDTNPARNRLLAFPHLVRCLLDIERTLQNDPIEEPAWNEIRELLGSLKPDLEKLEKHMARLELHSYGVIFEIINVLSLWELRFLPLAEKVFDLRRDHLEKALGALGEIEALIALSGPLVEQPDFVLPELLPGTEPQIEAEDLGHPLLDHEAAVRNPLSIGGDHNLLIVTGSNMAGKSTYLKSLGCNVVLAGIGGPVCARKFRWTPLRVYSDINVRDSLDDGKSYFQVEVERVQQVIQEAKESPHILAIFDELFRGTNVEERLTIARSLLRYMRKLGILLIVATHDGALTRLVTEDGEEGMVNFHFREQVEGQSMTFDYKLREGPTPTRNAIRVLEAAGYPEEITREARSGLGETQGIRSS